MPLSLTQSVTAVGINVPASFLAIGGTAPYTYAVVPGGAGGMVNPTTGAYFAPPAVSADPARAFDTIRVTDAVMDVATAQILVGTPLQLVCDIIQREMGLGVGDVYLWDQKIMQPKDSRLYVAVSELMCRPFGNVNRTVAVGGQLMSQSYVSMLTVLDINIISRSTAARDRKADVLLALGSVYSEQQQEVNSFFIGRLPAGARFLNLSDSDGAAIPYRYHISINIQYAVAKAKPVTYFNDFATPTSYQPLGGD